VFNIKNIIVPTDFSRLSQAAFEYACDLAERMDATIHLVYVLEKNPPFLVAKGLHVDEATVMKSMEEEAIKQLNELADELREDLLINILPVLRRGKDYEEIVNYAKETGAELIVIATHGRTGLLHNLLGSVAEKVIRYAKCPVLVINPPDEEI